MADYLSRHPSPFSGAVIKTEQMFNDWFTINVVNEFANDLEEAITAKGKKRQISLANQLAIQKRERKHIQYRSNTAVRF